MSYVLWQPINDMPRSKCALVCRKEALCLYRRGTPSSPGLSVVTVVQVADMCGCVWHRCSTPLMRSRQGVLHCVGCRLDVRHETPGADGTGMDATDPKVSLAC